MKSNTKYLVVLSLFALLPIASQAEEARGMERVGEGAVDTVSSPGKIVEGVSEDTEKHGAAGVVTGTARGTVNAAGQAVGGAVDVGTGVVETVLDPLTDN